MIYHVMIGHFAGRDGDRGTRSTSTPISERVARALDGRVRLSHDMIVMDFGAGTGPLGEHVAPQVEPVLAVDISPSMLARLADEAELRDRVETICQDLLATPLDRRVDLVVSAMAMHHVKDTRALTRTLHDHLVAGGRVALADLDLEDGSFHVPGTEGVLHAGFDRDALAKLMVEVGFGDLAFTTDCEVDREGWRYPVFLATAPRPSRGSATP